MSMPTLSTDRLVLRPFHADDADAVTREAGVREVAETTLNIPHPYPPGGAAGWIATLAPAHAAGNDLTLAITAGGELVGAVSLMISSRFARAELAYWIARAHWNRGVATEAARAIVAYGFGPLALHKISATHMVHNPASGRVMQKLGMRREGLLREHYHRDGRWLDVVVYGLLRSEWT
jgi:RimJ/RimL family protein N-acetyltransferase